MDGRVIPPPVLCILIRSCEASRLQDQLLARAYQQIYPEVRRALVGPKVPSPTAGCNRSPSTVAGAAAGA